METNDTTKERPILFKGEMVRAILNGTKTQTRRLVKPSPSPYVGTPFVSGDGVRFAHGNGGPAEFAVCRYGKPGDRLWVRETWGWSYSAAKDELGKGAEDRLLIDYAATPHDSTKHLIRWRPSIHMPRWASRITLGVVSVRVERLQDISGKDAEAEGIERCDNPDHGFINAVGGEIGRLGCPGCGGDPDGEAIKSYRSLWESINGPGSWDANPWVWVVTFRRILTTPTP